MKRTNFFIDTLSFRSVLLGKRTFLTFGQPELSTSRNDIAMLETGRQALSAAETPHLLKTGQAGCFCSTACVANWLHMRMDQAAGTGLLSASEPRRVVATLYPPVSDMARSTS
ncbi:hypothetical protein [uncultured Cohaesibacter sp.]|uniref:hypothetical protein n=1 Tax=uncultured Cohaesibacter sp. TaxID=1002546 RepID=UPI00292FE360|nr:hypothetical protein [uncultured Cohaesibacter sp.]